MNMQTLCNKAKEIWFNKMYEFVDTFINKDESPLNLEKKLNEPYKTMYENAKVLQGDFLSNIYLWEKVNIYRYEDENVKILFFEIYFKTSENGEVETFTSACCEYQRVCYPLGKI